MNFHLVLLPLVDLDSYLIILDPTPNYEKGKKN